MWRFAPVRGFSASTRTPTSIEVRQAALTVARAGEQLADVDRAAGTSSGPSPRSRPGVPQWRMAATPAASSHSFITIPPWTNPAEFASAIPIHRIRAELDAEAGLPSIRRSYAL